MGLLASIVVLSLVQGMFSGSKLVHGRFSDLKAGSKNPRLIYGWFNALVTGSTVV